MKKVYTVEGDPCHVCGNNLYYKKALTCTKCTGKRKRPVEYKSATFDSKLAKFLRRKI